ncbi:hypothetical protein I302_106607 [Kwoniella bestiolae CBS 10118]|uniref:SP-RING-type domain-containing protein n=1 Tax=Kwoniella bestiolae CBS 10118 TaxID=1296100 RepID=A0A1B9G0X9_9TREE|nr:hypothetical protein I302_06132 [Kwoniella bestiolae CBS 10118]OCF24671.1 hypothetical protein I302_06132 [Kwoniella bestiolae CBS 10118]
MPIRVSSDELPEAGPSRNSNSPRSSPGLDGDDDLIEEEGWTKETFENRSITKQNPAATPLLRTTMDKLKEVITRIEEGLELAKETAIALEDSKQDEPSIDDVEAAFFKALDQRQLLDIRIEALKELMAQLQAGQDFPNIESSYEELATPKETEYLAKSKRAKYKNSTEYAEFRSAIWEINHTTACPPVSQWLEKGPDDESDDDEIDIGGTTQTYRCPITLTLYQDATTSNKCGHSFSRAAIMDLIDSAKKQRRVSKCPVTGCAAVLEKSDLKANPSLQKRADEFARRERRREDEREEGDDTIAIDDDEEDGDY